MHVCAFPLRLHVSAEFVRTPCLEPQSTRRGEVAVEAINELSGVAGNKVRGAEALKTWKESQSVYCQI